MPGLVRTVISAAPATRRPIFARNQLMNGGLQPFSSEPTTASPWHPKSLVPAYDGWDTTIEKSFRKRKSKLTSKSFDRKGIANSALDLVGQTPVVRLSRLAKHVGIHDSVDLVAKCEFFNSGGSVKDRVALRMIEEAEKEGLLQKGDIIIEPTSGNTGVGLCMAAAIKGYKVVITMPLKMSGEKVNTMVALGAEIIRTPTEAAWDDEESHISLAKDLEAASGGKAHVLDQYRNSGNPLAHYEGTADELLEQCGNNLDVVVLAAGTGGTVTGVGKRIKEALPHCKVVAVDPVGSLLAVPEGLNARKRLQPYQVEGIGYDFLPTVLDRTVIDAWVKVDDREAFGMARACVKHEGLLVGGSSGSALAGAFAYIQDQGQALHGKRVAVLCADGVRNYMSKFLDDAWMNEHEFPLDVDFKHGTLSTSGEFTSNKQTNEEGGEQGHEAMEWTSMSPSEMLKAQALAFRMKELDTALSSNSISNSEYANQKAKLEKRLGSSSNGMITK